jgi:hypothetical protein
MPTPTSRPIAKPANNIHAERVLKCRNMIEILL